MENNIDFDKMRTRLYFMFTLSNLMSCFERDHGAKVDAILEVKIKIASFGIMIVHCQRFKDTIGFDANEMRSAANTLIKVITDEFDLITEKIKDGVPGVTDRTLTNRSMADQVDVIVLDGIDKIIATMKVIYGGGDSAASDAHKAKEVVI